MPMGRFAKKPCPVKGCRAKVDPRGMRFHLKRDHPNHNNNPAPEPELESIPEIVGPALSFMATEPQPSYRAHLEEALKDCQQECITQEKLVAQLEFAQHRLGDLHRHCELLSGALAEMDKAARPLAKHA